MDAGSRSGVPVANEEEMVIAIRRWTITPAVLIQQFRTTHTLYECAANPRMLLGDKEAALHGLAGGLDTIIEVLDVAANEIITFGSATSPTRAQWIVLYPNWTHKLALSKKASTSNQGRHSIGQGGPRPENRIGRMMRRKPDTILAAW